VTQSHCAPREAIAPVAAKNLANRAQRTRKGKIADSDSFAGRKNKYGFFTTSL
jgi:hypothetical protein